MSSAAFIGKASKNPYNFAHFNVSFAQLRYNNKAYPTDGYKIDFTKDLYMIPYRALWDNTGVSCYMRILHTNLILIHCLVCRSTTTILATASLTKVSQKEMLCTASIFRLVGDNANVICQCLSLTTLCLLAEKCNLYHLHKPHKGTIDLEIQFASNLAVRIHKNNHVCNY